MFLCLHPMQAQTVVADNFGLALALAVGLVGQPKSPTRYDEAFLLVTALL